MPQSSGRTTVKDVARRAGVSVGTVSNVLNGGRQVDPKLVEMVEAAVKELDYRRDPVARTLRTGRSHVIALVLDHLRHPGVDNASDHYWLLYVRAVAEECAVRGYDPVMLHPDHLDVIDAIPVDAFVLFEPSTDDAAVARLVATGRPVMTVSGTGSAVAVELDPPHRERVRLGFDHLRQRGSTSCALLVTSNHTTYGTAARQIADDWSQDTGVAVMIVEVEPDVNGVREGVRRCRESGVDGMFVEDVPAGVVLDALDEWEWRTPDEVRIVVNEDLSPLPVGRSEPTRIGYIAEGIMATMVESLVDVIEGRRESPVVVPLAVELVPGATT